MNAFELGKLHREMGYSEFYNPFRHCGSVADYCDWLSGYSPTRNDPLIITDPLAVVPLAENTL